MENETIQPQDAMFAYRNIEGKPINRELPKMELENMQTSVQKIATEKKNAPSKLLRDSLNSADSIFEPYVDKRIKTKDYVIDQSEAYKTLNDGTLTPMYPDFIRGTDNNERLAQNQSGWEQTINGLSKAGINTGSVVLGNTAGFVYGLADWARTGNFNAVYDNSFYRGLDDINTKLGFQLPNYYGKDQKDMNFFQKATTANFWANDVMNGLSFTLGTIVSEAIWAAATGGASLAVRAGRIGAKLGQGARALTGAARVGEDVAMAARVGEEVVSAGRFGKALLGTEKVAEGLANYKGMAYKFLDNAVSTGKMSTKTANAFAKTGEILNTTRFIATSSGNEAGIEAFHYKKEATENFYRNFEELNGRPPTAEESSEMLNKIEGSANWVMASNMAILGVSNLAMLGNLFKIKSPLGTLQKEVNNKLFGVGVKQVANETGELVYKGIQRKAWQKGAGYLYKGASPVVREGMFEEGLQGVTTKTANNWIERQYDPKYLNKIASLSDDAWKAMGEQYGTKEGWNEIGIGGIVGLIGGIRVAGKSITHEISDFSRLAEEQEKVVAKSLNAANVTMKTFVSDINAGRMMTMAKVMEAEDRAEQAMTKRDVVSAKLAHNDSMIALAEMYNNPLYGTGGLEQMERHGNNMIDTTEVSEQEKQELKAGFKSFIGEYKSANNFANSIVGSQGRIYGTKFQASDVQKALTYTILQGQSSKKMMDESLAEIGGFMGKDKQDAIDRNEDLQSLDKDTRTKFNQLAKEHQALETRSEALQKKIQLAEISVKEGQESRLPALQREVEAVAKRKLEINGELEVIAGKIATNKKLASSFGKELKDIPMTDEFISVQDLLDVEKNLTELEEAYKTLEAINPVSAQAVRESMSNYKRAQQSLLDHNSAIKLIASGKFKPQLADTNPFSGIYKKFAKGEEKADEHTSQFLTRLNEIRESYKNSVMGVGQEKDVEKYQAELAELSKKKKEDLTEDEVKRTQFLIENIAILQKDAKSPAKIQAKIDELEKELATIEDDNDPRIEEIDTLISELEKELKGTVEPVKNDTPSRENKNKQKVEELTSRIKVLEEELKNTPENVTVEQPVTTPQFTTTELENKIAELEEALITLENIAEEGVIEETIIEETQEIDIEQVGKISKEEKENVLVTNGLTIEQQDTSENVDEVIERNNELVVDNVISDNISEEDKKNIAEELGIAEEEVQEKVKEEVKKAIKNKGKVSFNLPTKLRALVSKIVKFLLSTGLLLTITFNAGNVRNYTSRVVSDISTNITPKDTISFNETTFSVTSFDGCAAYVSNQVKSVIGKDKFEKFGFYGDAWTINGNLVRAGNGTYLFNAFTDFTKKENIGIDEIRATVKQQVTQSQEKLKNIEFREGDIVNLFYEGSNAQEEAYNRGKDSYTSHIGIIKKDGKGNLFLEHNIHGLIKKDSLSDLVQGKLTSPKGVMLASGVVRPKFEKIGLTVEKNKGNTPLEEAALGGIALLSLIVKRRKKGGSVSRKLLTKAKKTIAKEIETLKKDLAETRVKSTIQPETQTVGQPNPRIKEIEKEINNLKREIDKLNLQIELTPKEALKARIEDILKLFKTSFVGTYDVDEAVKSRPDQKDIDRYNELKNNPIVNNFEVQKTFDVNLVSEKDRVLLEEFRALKEKLSQWRVYDSLAEDEQSVADLLDILAQLETEVEEINTLTEPNIEDTFEELKKTATVDILELSVNTNYPVTVKRETNGNYSITHMNPSSLLQRMGATNVEIDKKSVSLKEVDDQKKQGMKVTFISGGVPMNFKIAERGRIEIEESYFKAIPDVKPIESMTSWSYVPLYEKNFEGNYEKPIPSDYVDDTITGDTHNLKEEDAVELFIDINDEYNKKLLDKYNKSKAEDKEKTEELENQVVIHIRRKGDKYGTVKGLTAANRKEILGSESGIKTLRELAAKALKEGKSGVLATTKVKYVQLGNPVLSIDGNGRIAQMPITDKGLEIIEAYGFVQDGEITLNKKVDDVRRSFIKKITEKNKGKKVPIVVIKRGAQMIAFPVHMIKTNDSKAEDLATILYDTEKTDAQKVKAINDLLLQNGIAASEFDLITYDEQKIAAIEERLAANQGFKTAEQLIDKNYKKENLKNDVTIALDLDNYKVSLPSQKFNIDLEKLDYETLPDVRIEKQEVVEKVAEKVVETPIVEAAKAQVNTRRTSSRGIKKHTVEFTAEDFQIKALPKPLADKIKKQKSANKILDYNESDFVALNKAGIVVRERNAPTTPKESKVADVEEIAQTIVDKITTEEIDEEVIVETTVSEMAVSEEALDRIAAKIFKSGLSPKEYVDIEEDLEENAVILADLGYIKLAIEKLKPKVIVENNNNKSAKKQTSATINEPIETANLISFDTTDLTGTATTFYKKGNKWGYIDRSGFFVSLIPRAQAKVESDYQKQKETVKAEKESIC